MWNTDASRVQPQFKCPNKNDAFSVSDTERGNGALTYPVGLITADEITAAGSGKYYTANNSYYLAKGSWYWTISPSSFNGSYANTFRVHGSGDLGGTLVANSENAFVPVINLKPEYVKTMIGTGIATDPYRDASDNI